MYRYLGQLEGWGWGEEQQKEKQVAQWGRTGVREEIGGQKQHPTRGSERVTGRKARGLQTEEIACKCQPFLSGLSGRRKQTSDIFSFSIQI